ncbi:ras association domain-containing protein 2-like isoform X2 [Amphiura filiformis]|uniref:ras association domain-containing protein 2-like isoform X2 n=1 Tax=Amphiura filiformis TaxID=82378 RepID=UPI003B22753B
MGDTDYEEEKMRMYRGIISRNQFPRQLHQYNLYHQDSKHQPQLQVVQEKGTLVIFGMLKIYWGVQKVIRLKKEELSWKRRSTRMAYENGLDEKLMSAMGSGAKTRRSLSKLNSVDDDAENDGEENSTNGHGEENGQDEGGEDGENKTDSIILTGSGSSTMPHKGRGNINRRTMSFSGHIYKSNTAVFRPKYGTVSNVRVSSKLNTPEVISLLLRKFAVENSPVEFNLYEVMQHGESREMKTVDFPLLRRVVLGPDEHVAKVFIMEKKTQEISPEIAQYINLQMPVLDAIIRKFNEEEERELEKIKHRYAQYKANLQKKMATISTDVNKKKKGGFFGWRK